MAVSKMQKLTLLTNRSDQEKLLKSIQEFQAFEPIALDLSQGVGDHLGPQSDIQALDSELAQILQAQVYLKSVTPKSIWSNRFELTADEFESEVEQVKNRQVLQQVLDLQQSNLVLDKKMRELDEEIALATKWSALPFLKKDRQQLRAVYVVAGTIANDQHQEGLGKLLAQENYFVEKLFQNEFEHGLVVYADRHQKEELKVFLEDLHFSKFDFPYDKLPAEKINDFKAERQSVLAQQKESAKAVKALGQFYGDLMLLEEDVYNRRERKRAAFLLESGQDIVALSGWSLASQTEHLQQLLRETLDEGSYVCLVEHMSADEDNIPTHLENHPLVEPFELLTEMYSLPRYSEVDPTPLLAPFYAIFFGMMAADVGYGLLLWIGTWYLLNKTKAPKVSRKNYKLFHILSYPTILWGLFFGSFFGIELPFHVLSTTTDVISILIVSVVFGLVQLIFGLAVNTHLQIKSRNYPSAVSDGLGWIGLLVGVILLALNNVVGMQVLGEIAKWLIILNVIVIILGTAIGSHNKLLGIGSGLYKLYGATSYIGDIASYTRLMALSVSGASIAASFNMVVGLLPPLARFTVGIPLIIALQMLNMGMSFLGAYVHAIRLQFVEFFGKFYEGGGRAFKPLKTYEKYTDLKTRKLEK